MRVKIIEVFKFLVALAIGYSIRLMVENTKQTDSFTKVNEKENILNWNLDSTSDQLIQPYQPKSYKDLIEYRYFNISVIFDTHLGQIESQIKPYHRNALLDIINQVKTHINNGQAKKFTVSSLLNGFERIDPVRGKEYVLELELKSNIKSRERKIHRITLVKPFSYAQIVTQIDVTARTHNFINLVIPISNYEVFNIQSILYNYAKRVVTISGESQQIPRTNLTLLFCVTNLRHQSIIDYIDKFRQINSHLFSNKFHQISAIFLRGNNSANCSLFHSVKMRNEAIKKLSSLNLILLTPSANITRDFVLRCHSILADNLDTFYVPIPFALFRNIDSAYNNQPDSLGEEYGIWDHNYYDVMCINRQLIEKAGYFDESVPLDISSKLFIDKLIHIKKEIFRSTDPSVKISHNQLSCKEQSIISIADKSHCIYNQQRTFQSQSKTLRSFSVIY